MTPHEEWFVVGVYGPHLAPEARLARAIDALNQRPDIVRPYVLMVHPDTEAALATARFPVPGVAEIRGRSFVPAGDYRFLKVVAS